jgi:hypothetical protein
MDWIEVGQPHRLLALADRELVWLQPLRDMSKIGDRKTFGHRFLPLTAGYPGIAAIGGSVLSCRRVRRTGNTVSISGFSKFRLRR